MVFLRILELARGRIMIDGVDISTLSLKKLRSSITLIPQDPALFENTIRINLDPLNNFPDERLWEILKLVGLKESFMTRDGLETEILKNGSNLSSGEKQLVCIARGLLKRSKIVLLDEATSSIDSATENKIQAAIE